jgi:hypothetical protein
MIEKDQRNLLIIGGIQIFLPSSQDEAKEIVVGATTTERQPVVIVKEMEQISEATQGKEEEHIVEMLTPWEKGLEVLEDWMNNPEPIDDYREETVM